MCTLFGLSPGAVGDKLRRGRGLIGFVHSQARPAIPTRTTWRRCVATLPSLYGSCRSFQPLEKGFSRILEFCSAFGATKGQTTGVGVSLVQYESCGGRLSDDGGRGGREDASSVDSSAQSGTLLAGPLTQLIPAL